MNNFRPLPEYADEVGGVFCFGELEVIPYNHWKKDVEWLVLVLENGWHGAFIPVDALTARDACTMAVEKYKFLKKEGKNERL